jgi:hypothetical protein
MPVGQPIAAAIYNFVRLPVAGVRNNDRGPDFALKVCKSLSAIIGHNEICMQRGLSSMQAAIAIGAG